MSACNNEYVHDPIMRHLIDRHAKVPNECLHESVYDDSLYDESPQSEPVKRKGTHKGKFGMRSLKELAKLQSRNGSIASDRQDSMLVRYNV